MRQKLIKVAFVAAIAFVSGITVFNSQKSELELSDIALANVEALASGESDGYCRTSLDYNAICNYYDKGAICPCGM